MTASPVTLAPAPTALHRRPSRALFAGVLVLALALLTLNFGLVDLIDGFTGLVDQNRNVVLDAGWGAVFGVVLPLGLLAQLRRPGQRIAGLQQTALVAVVLAGAGVAGRSWWYVALGTALLTATGLLLAVHPARSEMLRRGASARLSILGLAMVAAFPCLVYAHRMLSAQRRGEPPFDAVSNGMHHWTVMAALGLAVVGLAVLASLGTHGWRIPGWSAALAALVWGVSSVRAPTAAGAEGRAWAIAAIAWALAMIAVTAGAGRMPRPRRGILGPKALIRLGSPLP